MNASLPSVDQYRIVAICLGNICRSPMAEAVLRSRVAEAGLDGLVAVDSAGTGSWHVGHEPDRRAMRALRERGYDIAHTARRVDPGEIDATGLVVAMDRWNLADLRDLVGDSSALSRIHLMRSFDPNLTHLPEDDGRLDVPDPYYGTLDDFQSVLDMIEIAASGVIDQARLDLAL